MRFNITYKLQMKHTDELKIVSWWNVKGLKIDDSAIIFYDKTRNGSTFKSVPLWRVSDLKIESVK